MELTFEQISAAAVGADRVIRQGEAILFRRFSPAQEEAAAAREERNANRVSYPAGVRLVFRTDSRTLSLSFHVPVTAPSRRFFAVDVLTDGRFVGSVDNFTGADLPANYGDAFRPEVGDFSGSFELGAGEKTVTLCLPWSVRMELGSLSLDDGASFAPAGPEKRLVFYGDSITQGFDALHPRLSYAARLADEVGLALYDKAISGDVIFPELARRESGPAPEAVLIAYGTNDWSHLEADEFEDGYRRFLASITKLWPGVPVLALTPLTRMDAEKPHRMGPFSTMRERIARAAEGFADVRVIDCSDFFPADLALYSDGFLHPSQAGMDRYFRALLPHLRAALDARHG